MHVRKTHRLILWKMRMNVNRLIGWRIVLHNVTRKSMLSMLNYVMSRMIN